MKPLAANGIIDCEMIYRHRYRDVFIITANTVMLAGLIFITRTTPLTRADWLPAFPFFLTLSVFTLTFGISLGSINMSLHPMVVIAAVLVMGLVPTSWMLLVGAWIHGFIRRWWSEPLRIPSPKTLFGLIRVTAVNSVMHTVSLIAAWHLMRVLGRELFFSTVNFAYLPSLALFSLIYFLYNYIFAAGYYVIEGKEILLVYLRKLPFITLYELPPVIFAVLAAVIFIELGPIYFSGFGLALVIISLITHSLEIMRQGLEQRVQELNSLQAVGQALNASLRLPELIPAIHDQVVKLMPVEAFYVALYDADADEVSFPFVIEDGHRANWAARRFGSGFTEYVLHSRRPLLAGQDDLNALRQELGIKQHGRQAACWLGAPMLAGEQALGVIAVQSYTEPGIYDETHKRVLMTIASQAALAIQNARLYDQTDMALAQRVQELDSILQTTNDGIMLLNPDCQALMINRAFLEFSGLEIDQADLRGETLLTPASSQDEETILSQIGFTPETMQAACDSLALGTERWHQKQITMSGPPERDVERTLVPVFGRDNEISGWLLVFRDVTEELELARTRTEMAHMLVHDLRSPLSVIMGGLDTSRGWLETGQVEGVVPMLEIAQNSGAHMLNLINDLLDIYKLERGEMPLQIEAVPLKSVLSDAKERFGPLLEKAGIMMVVDVASDLPPIPADWDKLSRLLCNLVDNAIKFTPDDGRIHLWAKNEPDGDKPNVLIGVSDTGQGIPADGFDKLFKMFCHDFAGKGRRRGTGLGLPFCKLVAEAHGGQIWAESAGVPGEGSTFFVRLPLQPEEEE